MTSSRWHGLVVPGYARRRRLTYNSTVASGDLSSCAMAPAMRPTSANRCASAARCSSASVSVRSAKKIAVPPALINDDV